MAPLNIAQQLSRRSLLKTGLVGVAVVAVGGFGLTLQPSRRSKVSAPLRVLTVEEHAVLAAIAARVCPALGEGAPGADALDIAGQADRMLEAAEYDVQQGVKLALRVFESGLSGALFVERVRPFTQLSASEQDQVLTYYRHSHLGFRRTLYRALSSLCGALYYGDERTWKRIGYPGPPSTLGLRTTYAENLVDLHALRATKGP